MTIFDFIIFIFSIFLLFYSGGVMVRNLTVAGRYLRISEFVLSFVFAAFATSLPEFFIGLTSAIKGTPNLSLGNVIGANVLDVTLVLGAAAVFAGSLNLDRVIKKEDFEITFGILILPVFLLVDGVLNRYDGFLLLFLFIGYLAYLFHQERVVLPVDGNIDEPPTFAGFFTSIGKFFLATVILLGSSYIVVSKSVVLSQFFSLPLFFIGILLAIGTTLPEVIFGIRSVALGHKAMAFGNAFGSIIVNLAFISGLVGVIRPVTILNFPRILIGIFITAGLVLFINLLISLKGYISRSVGIFLILIAILFIIIESLLI